jgi:hypothetical protein
MQRVGGVPKLDVFIQDQNSLAGVITMHNDQSTATLAVQALPGDTTLTLEAGHTVTAGQLLFLIKPRLFFESVVTNVVTNTISIDRPVCQVFPVTSEVVAGIWNANVNGSVTPQIFHVKPPPGQVWDTTAIHVAITDNSAMDDSLFGGITALTNGVLLRKKLNSKGYENRGLIKNNGDLRLVCDADYAARAPSGEFGISGKCKFQGGGNLGVTIRVDANQDEELEMLIQDDLLAILTLKAVVLYHVVV